MRVLVFAPTVPWPPNQGAAIRNFHIVRALAKRHDVTLIAFGDPEAEAAPLTQAGVEVIAIPPPGPRGMPRRLMDLVTSPAPDLARRLRSETMMAAARLKAVIEEPFDVVEVEGLEMAPYGLAVRQSTPMGQRARLIYDAHNAEWVLQRRAAAADAEDRRRWPVAAYSMVQAVKLRRFETRMLRASETTVAVSDADAAALRALAPQAHIVVAPNGVDTRYFTPGDGANIDEDLVVFVGKMDFRPNVDAVRWFCGEVWGRVRAARPEARFVIVGRDPAPAVRALATKPGVTITGAVDDVRPWLHRAAVVVAPLRVGGGTRLKVLEAMAAAKAVVATSLAVDGLEVARDQEVVIADEARDMAHQILALAADEDRRLELGAAARRRAEFQYQWEQVGWRLEAVVRNGAGSPI
ncbi:MAG: glycosyltransferase [Anaerolineae bacterium]